MGRRRSRSSGVPGTVGSTKKLNFIRRFPPIVGLASRGTALARPAPHARATRGSRAPQRIARSFEALAQRLSVDNLEVPPLALGFRTILEDVEVLERLVGARPHPLLPLVVVVLEPLDRLDDLVVVCS